MSNTKPMMELALNFATFKSWIEDNEAVLTIALTAIGIALTAIGIIVAIYFGIKQLKRKPSHPPKSENNGTGNTQINHLGSGDNITHTGDGDVHIKK